MIPGHYSIDHARDEWAFFRMMGRRGRWMRSTWAMHYARLRGWTDKGSRIVDP